MSDWPTQLQAYQTASQKLDPAAKAEFDFRYNFLHQLWGDDARNACTKIYLDIRLAGLKTANGEYVTSETKENLYGWFTFHAAHLSRVDFISLFHPSPHLFSPGRQTRSRSALQLRDPPPQPALHAPAPAQPPPVVPQNPAPQQPVRAAEPDHAPVIGTPHAPIASTELLNHLDVLLSLDPRTVPRSLRHVIALLHALDVASLPTTTDVYIRQTLHSLITESLIEGVFERSHLVPLRELGMVIPQILHPLLTPAAAQSMYRDRRPRQGYPHRGRFQSRSFGFGRQGSRSRSRSRSNSRSRGPRRSPQQGGGRAP